MPAKQKSKKPAPARKPARKAPVAARAPPPRKASPPKPKAPVLAPPAHKDPMAQAEHEHQDPRVGAAGSSVGPSSSHADPRALNWGQQKTKSVGRLEHVTNWFRRGRGR